MSRKKSRGGRIDGPFVALLKETLDTPAWRAMSHGARSLYTALKRRYNNNPQNSNNGRLHISQREAMGELGSWSNQIARWFRELQFYGFIVMTKGGSLGLNGKGTAPHWRLTELVYMHDPPTRDFRKWDGVKFKDAERRSRKTESRKGNPLHPVREMKDTPVREMKDTFGNKRKGNPLHG
jgi:hypothetical protein